MIQQQAGRVSIVLLMLGCFLLIAVSGCQSEREVQPRIFHHEVENGAAALIYSASINQKFVFSADLNLPARSQNQSWYALWLMVGERKDAHDLPAMLRLGLIRWEQTQFQAQAFYATEHSSHQLDVSAVPGIVDDFHKFAITNDSTVIQLKMDDRVLFSTRAAEFFNGQTPIFLKIGAEVYADGDRASGVVRNVVMDGQGVQGQSAAPESGFDDRGLRFACAGMGQWEAQGKFDPSLPLVRFVPPVCR